MLPPTNFKSEPSSMSAPLVADALLGNLVGTCVADLPVTLQALHPLNFQQLSAFEQVMHQFGHRGVEFSGAIALVPSNPKFIKQSGQKVIMSESQGQRKYQMQLRLQPMVTQICIAGRSTQPILLEMLDAGGDIVAVQNGVMCPLPESLQHDTSRLPGQVFKLEPPHHGCLRLTAKAPFIISSIAV